MTTHPLPLLLLALSGVASAQTVDFPGSTLAQPPQTAFPFYTPGGGATGQTVRLQLLCPASFLASQNVGAGLVTHVGFSLAGQAVYDTFVLRAGVTTVTTLGSDWAVNLPDQRVQCDRSNEPLAGGGTASAPVNQWIEFALDVPFAWQPGESLVVDLTTHLAVAGSYLGTTSGAPVVPRACNFAYTPGALATTFTGNGPAVRFVFAPHGLVPFGSGCHAPGGVTPNLSMVGTANPGTTLALVADQTLAPAVGGFVCGLSRTTAVFGPLPLALGGGCALLVAPDVFVLAPVTPLGSGLGCASTAVVLPNDPLLRGTVVYTQWAQFDAGAPGTLPLTFSPGGMIVVF